MWGCVFSVYPFLVWWLREYIYFVVLSSSSEVWTISHCLGLGHETMVCAVCSFGYSPTNLINLQSCCKNSSWFLAWFCALDWPLMSCMLARVLEILFWVIFVVDLLVGLWIFNRAAYLSNVITNCTVHVIDYSPSLCNYILVCFYLYPHAIFPPIISYLILTISKWGLSKSTMPQ